MLIALAASAQPIPSQLKGIARKSFLDSTLKNAGATPAQIQQFDAAKAQANTKVKQAKQDTALNVAQKEAKYKQINDEKNASYKSILGAEVYKAYNNLKTLKMPAQVAELNRPSPNKVVRDCLDSVNASSSQKQQFMQVKKLYKDSVKAVMANASLSAVQKQQQRMVLTQHKNAQYTQILGTVVYARFNLAKKRRAERDDN